MHHSLTHAPKTIMTQQEITASGASSLAQALQELGGIQLIDTTGNGSQVALSMRGFGINASSNTLLLINGIPITNPDLAPPDLNAIPLSDIKYIEITAGSESVLYGDQAVGGVVNIVTHPHKQDKIKLSCSAGSYNQHACDAAWNIQSQQFHYGFHLFTTHTDNYRQQNDYDQNHISGNVNYDYQTGSIQFYYQVANEYMQYPGALTAEQVTQNRRQANNNINFFRDWNGHYQLHNQQQLSPTWHIDTDFMRREMHGHGILTLPFNQSRLIHFIKPQLEGTIGKALVVSGIDFEDDRYYLNSFLGITDDIQQKYGIYSVVNYPLTTRLSLSFGIRGAQQNNQLRSLEPFYAINRALATTLGSTFQLQPNMKIFVRRAENYRFPKADENASAPIGINGLKTQRGVSYETGLQTQWKKWTHEIDIYQLNLKDEITFDPMQTVQQPFGSNRNLDPTTRIGLSLSETYAINHQFTVGGQYNAVSAHFQSGIHSGNRIPLVAQNIFHTNLNYKISERWNLFTEAVYTGNQYAANDDSNTAGKIGGYTIYNVNCQYQFKGFSAAFRINNIFNKYYYFYTVFQPSMQEEFFYPAPGRNVLFTLNYNIA